MEKKKSKAVIFANIVLGGTVILFILVIFYSWYRSSSLHIPLNLKLIVLLTAGLLFSIITLFMRDNWKTNLAIAVFSTLLAAYCVEFVLFFRSQSRFSPVDIDTRNKLEVLEDLHAEDVDAWPRTIPYLFVESNGLLSDNNRIFPIGGISQKTIVFCNESGQYINFKSDEHGFNNPERLYVKGITKVVLVGDSFAQGDCVPPGEDIASQLRNVGIRALNLGNGGNGPLIELALLKEYVEPFMPEIVLWVYYEGNDLYELKQERKASMLMSYFEEGYSQNLLERQDEIDAVLMDYADSQRIKELNKPLAQRRIVNLPLQMQALEAKEKRRKVITLWYLRSRLGSINTSHHKQHSKRSTNYKPQLPLLSEILATAYQRTTGWGGKFYFVYLPIMKRYVNNNFSGSFFGRDDVLAIVHKLGIPVIDFHEVLKKHPDPLSLTPFLGAHYNSEGYELVSESIVSRLRKDGLI